MKYGVIFPHESIAHRTDHIRRYAQSLEAAGFDYLAVYEHVLGADVSLRPDWVGSYTSENTLHELVSGVLVLPQRQTALVAKQAADLDLLLDGRLRLGVGAGWNEVEFSALGMDYHTRGARLEEQIELLRLLWTQDSVTFDGRFDAIDRASINPRPKQQPIPIWMGGAAARNVKAEPQTDRVLERIGRLSDGWICGGRPMEELERSWIAVRSAAEKAGRDPSRLGLQPTATVRTPADLPALDRTFDAWQRMGVTHVAFSLGDKSGSLDDHFRLLEAVSHHLKL
jgi:probable F420-dependent oxidoreductase